MIDQEEVEDNTYESINLAYESDSDIGLQTETISLELQDICQKASPSFTKFSKNSDLSTIASDPDEFEEVPDEVKNTIVVKENRERLAKELNAALEKRAQENSDQEAEGSDAVTTGIGPRETTNRCITSIYRFFKINVYFVAACIVMVLMISLLYFVTKVVNRHIKDMNGGVVDDRLSNDTDFETFLQTPVSLDEDD